MYFEGIIQMTLKNIFMHLRMFVEVILSIRFTVAASKTKAITGTESSKNES